MMILVAVVGFGLLFALAAVALPQRRSCGGSCGSCEGACERADAEAPAGH